MSSSHDPTSRRSLALIAAAITLCLLLGWLAYRAFLAAYLDNERHLTAQRLDSFALSLEATLSRHESLPGVLALDHSLAALLKDPGNPALVAAANAYLEAAQQGAAVAAAYLIDTRGNTLAASNWRLPRSFVGQNYAFRPYFTEAMKGGLGRFYGVGATTGEPGYFLASPLREGKRIVGVLAVKVGLDSLEQALASSGDALLLADADGVVFLSSVRSWRYRLLAGLGPEARARVAETRQYGSHPLGLLADRPIPLEAGALVRLSLPGEPARERLVQSRPVGALGWQVVQFVDPSEARRSALGAGSAVALAAGLVVALVAFQSHRRRRSEELRRVHASLEARIAERTADLTAKIEALKTTEAILRETRDAAVQAGKLAVLGQMAAGISHELNQPLAALRTFADNAVALLAKGRHAEVAENLAMIGDLVDRAGRIVRQLKTFARKGPAEMEPVGVAAAIEHALLIIEPRRRELGAAIAVADCPPGLAVSAEPVRLEQVLVNLLRNGLDAMAGERAPRLEVSARTDGARAEIAIRDHGPGVAPAVLPHLFEPFYTTKPVGEGLGLGLAISLAIVEGFGGRLEARNQPDGGAEFVIILEAVPLENAAHAPPHP